MKRLLITAALSLACAAAVPFAQSDPRNALLEKAGWEALHAAQPRDAADHFRDALANDPQNARLHLGAGIAAYAEHRDADARAELQRALTIAPKLTEARTLLARVQYRMDDRAAAIASLETVLTEAPDAADVRATVERWRREAELHDSMA